MGALVSMVGGEKLELPIVDPKIITITDIAHSLSMQCRFNGHIDKFYSVAEHSVIMARSLREQDYSREIQLEGLLHDAAEAYTGDIIKPIKDYLMSERFYMMDGYISGAIMKKYKLSHCLEEFPEGSFYVMSKSIDEHDKSLCRHEVNHLRKADASFKLEEFDDRFHMPLGLKPKYAKMEFLLTFAEIIDENSRSSRKSYFGERHIC